jgi:hypothetical protein
MTSLFPPRESLVVTSRLGTGNLRTFFYGVLLAVEGMGPMHMYVHTCTYMYIRLAVERDTPCSPYCRRWKRIHRARRRPYCWQWNGIHPGLHVQTAGRGKWYTLHVHTAGRWKGWALHVHILLAVERDAPCKSILLVVEKDTPYTSILPVAETDTSCMSILLAVERDAPCTSILVTGQLVRHCRAMYMSSVLRIRPSRIPDLNFFHPGSLIPDPPSNNLSILTLTLCRPEKKIGF